MRFRLDVVKGPRAPEVIEVESPTLAAAHTEAVRLGYSVLSAQPRAEWHSALFGLRNRRGARLDVVVFVEQLRDLLTAGMSVIEALETLHRSADVNHRQVLEELTRSLHSGQRLSQALNDLENFSPLLVSLVRASELTSDLPQALSRFLDHEQRVIELRHRLSALAIYPLMLMAVGAAVLLFLLFYVMPRFARVFEGMNGDLPWSARGMIWWAQWLNAYGSIVLGAVVALSLAITAAAFSQPIRNDVSKRILEWRPLRTRLRTYFLARWYRATGMLIDGGIPMPEALRLSTELLPLALRDGGQTVERSLREGRSPALAYAGAGMATPVAEQLMRAGERTGDMGGVLGRIARFHEAEVSRALERGMRTLEPLIMVLIGVGVGTVVVLMYMPIFELAAAIQ